MRIYRNQGSSLNTAQKLRDFCTFYNILTQKNANEVYPISWYTHTHNTIYNIYSIVL